MNHKFNPIRIFSLKSEMWTGSRSKQCTPPWCVDWRGYWAFGPSNVDRFINFRLRSQSNDQVTGKSLDVLEVKVLTSRSKGAQKLVCATLGPMCGRCEDCFGIHFWPTPSANFVIFIIIKLSSRTPRCSEDRNLVIWHLPGSIYRKLSVDPRPVPGGG